MPLFQQRKGPVLSTLSDRKTLVLREPLVRKLGLNPLGGFRGQITLPPGISREVFDTVKDKWGRKLAEGMAEKMEREGAAMPPEARKVFVENWADVVTLGLLRG